MEMEYRCAVPADLPSVLGLMPALYREIGAGLPKVLAEFIADKNYFKLQRRPALRRVLWSAAAGWGG